MADSIEISAKTVHDAIALGLQRLGKKQDEVTVEIITEGSRGILGIGAEDARVRLTARRPIQVEPPPSVTLPPVLAPGAAVANTKPAPPSESSDVPPEVMDVAKEVVEDLLRLMGLKGQVTMRGLEPRGVRTPDDGTPTCTADITGEDLGILIGRRGENLSALQYITNLIVSKRTGSNARIVVDVEHYLVRRYQSLRGLAQRMAERVTQSKTAITLEPMPPHERRIIHITLADHPAVTTASIGEGEERRVVISPKK